MEPTIEILISSPVSGSEAAALRDIVIALRPPALVLANFELTPSGKSRQIDFVAITEQRAELIELKAFTAPVKGGFNGSWQIETSPGLFVPYSGPNPWEQARDAKLALSDAMHDYAKRRPDVPRPARRRYFEQFDASVTVYPVLVPGSQVCGGNYKAWVRSFPDTLDALTARPLPVRPTWGIHDWRTFATDHLGLTPATLSEAIDATVFQAHQALEEYAARLQQPEIAPLLQSHDNELIGENVIDRLGGPSDVLLLGRSGLGKSFHLEHYRRRCFAADEVPILLQARYYQRDLNKAIHKSIGQYTRLTPAELLDAAKRLGKRPVLIVDAWDDCPGSMQADLGDDLGAFQLRYDARLVTASQTVPPHPRFATAAKLELGALRQEHKEAIFAFHAGRQSQSIPAHCCEPFSTAFDLSIAGRCQGNGAVTQTRAELYDSYVRSMLPSLSARSVLRKLAWYMGENFKPALPVGDYERVVESLVQQLGVPISAADELLKSRLLAVEREVVTFEHDLLKDYFRAEHLLREMQLSHLAGKLEEPKYAGLAEFVVPAVSDHHVLRELLAKADVDFLNIAFRGWLGAAARRIVRGECQRLLTECRDRLPEITVEASIGEFGDGRRFISAAVVVGPSCVSDLERKLCAVLADNLGDELVRDDFLNLLDLGEWALKEASDRAASQLRVKPIAVWRELVRLNTFMSPAGAVHPVLFICHEIRENLMRSALRSNRLPVHDALLQRVREGKAGALALLLLIFDLRFRMMFDLRFRDSINMADVLTITRQAWDTNVEIIRLEALDLIQWNAHAICETGPEAEAAVVALLDDFDVSKNIMLSTQWVETRSCFAGFETGIDTNTALDEFRRIVAMAEAGDDPLYQLKREADPSVTFSQFIAGWASGTLGKIFEDIFHGAYYDAYHSLSEEEKRKLLILALQDTRIGLFTDWYMRQLCNIGCEGAQDILRRYGSRIDPDTFCPQDCVTCFIMANEAWAEIADEPILYSEISSPDHQAWAIIGELIFWLNRDDDGESQSRASFLCDELLRLPAVLPGVLREIGHSYKGMEPAPVLKLLLTRHRDGIRRTLHESLKYEGQLTSAFRQAQPQNQLFLWTISTLGDIGDRESIVLLKAWTESTIYGRDAIRSIEQIEQRENRFA